MHAATTGNAAAHALEDHALYQAPDRECDVVMKGGITSGVVYPHAVCELARRFRLRSVGGTSAGAIAAACAAAAELGREVPGGGFARIASLPRRLGERAPDGAVRLLSLFQPRPETRPLFGLLLAATRKGRFKGLRLWGALLRHGGRWTVLGALPAVAAAAALAIDRSPVSALGGLGLALLLLVGATAAALARQWRALTRHVPRGLFGVCSGLRAGAGRAPGLTEWLHEELQALAGLGPDAPPLTFADLRTHGVDLQVITTCLTHGRPYGLPGLRRTLYFDPVELRRLFPAAVVDALERSGRQLVADDAQRPVRSVEHACMHPRLPLPKGDALPVIVAVRMSLAFPLLLSAVPLWDYDWGGDGLSPRSAAATARGRVTDSSRWRSRTRRASTRTGRAWPPPTRATRRRWGASSAASWARCRTGPTPRCSSCPASATASPRCTSRPTRAA